jgi:preprotein translocase subunit SecA
MNVLKKIFGDPNAKVLKDLEENAGKVNALEAQIEPLSDEQLKEKTEEFKKRLKDGATLEDIVFEAFAVVREAAKRTLEQRHYDVQLMGGFVLHKGMIAEMRTGEGKTLTSTLPIYLNALSGKGVHVITVNDYLAKRDAVWMGQIFGFLGLSIGCIQHESGYVYDESFKADTEDDEKRDETGGFKVQMDFLRPVSRQDAYAQDITYGTNNEFGFDFLRDNMVTDEEKMVQRELNFAIIDEIDSILIDEARTPLIISAPAEESADFYIKFAGLVKDLKEDTDYNIDEKMRVATFTDVGLTKLEKRLGVDNLYTGGGLELIHHAEQALKAHAIFFKDKNYVVQEGEVKIVDEFTGRIMEGRRYSEGLHQAIEAKEGVDIKRESRTLATITFQNYFRMYNKLSGMTGTAATEAEEFDKIYNLDVVEIPTNMPIAREDLSDRVYKNKRGKLLSVIEEIKMRQEKGQPVLLGTVSIEDNELLSELLTKSGVKHTLLNAKNHESEGEIVAQAGKKGAVTVATNMAGRGVDIKLGGNPTTPELEQEIKDLGGLHVIGTERHESRRIDNQLRGRSGRQGDPGSTQFYVSTEDDLMRIFGSDRARKMMETFKIEETMPIESKLISSSLEKSQQRVEGRNFDTRKHLLEYDDVLNKHREGIYEQRKAMLVGADDPQEKILEMVEGEVERVILFHTGDSVDIPDDFKAEDKKGDWDPQEIIEVLKTILEPGESLEKKIKEELKEVSKDKEVLATQRTTVIESFMQEVRSKFDDVNEKVEDKDRFKKMLKTLILRATDNMWVRHLDEMTYLRRSIGLRGYGQRDPLIEYKKESFVMYGELEAKIDREIVYNVFKVIDQAMVAHQVLKFAPSLIERANLQMQGARKTMGSRAAAKVVQAAAIANAEKVGRNDDCPCGSGKKYKKCHGA